MEAGFFTDGSTVVETDELPQTTLNELVKTIKTAFGNNVEVQFEFPNEIPILSSGKHQYAVLELK